MMRSKKKGTDIAVDFSSIEDWKELARFEAVGDEPLALVDCTRAWAVKVDGAFWAVKFIRLEAAKDQDLGIMVFKGLGGGDSPRREYTPSILFLKNRGKRDDVPLADMLRRLFQRAVGAVAFRNALRKKTLRVFTARGAPFGLDADVERGLAAKLAETQKRFSHYDHVRFEFMKAVDSARQNAVLAPKVGHA